MSIFRKLCYLLTANERRRATVLLGLLLVGMVLETVAVGLIIPAVTLLASNDITTAYPGFRSWMEPFSGLKRERLIVIGMLGLVGIYAIKALFLAFLAWRQARFIHDLEAGLSQRLFAGYLRQPYAFHLQRNSAQLIAMTGRVSEITTVVHLSLMLIAELLVMTSISMLLLAVEPLGALLVVIVFGFAAGVFNFLTRKRILRWGSALYSHEVLRIQHLQQGLGSAKDVKLLGREAHFLHQYRIHSAKSAWLGHRRDTLQALPKLWLELLAVSGLAALVLVMIGQGKPLAAIMPALGLFAAAAFRLLPSVNRMIIAFQNLRFSLPYIDTLTNEFRLAEGLTEPLRGPRLLFKRQLTIDAVGFRYAKANTDALSEVSMTIPRGASVGFVGGSGAGKSTLIDVVLGLLVPSSGCVCVDGVDIQSNLRGWQDQIGYVPQTIFLTDDTLRRNVAFGLASNEIDDEAVIRALKAAQLWEFACGLSQGLETEVGERGVRLSGGQRQRIGIARAIYHDPSVLVLDEATSSLDTETESGVMEAVRAMQGSKTVLIIAHRLTTVAHCDLVFRLDRGRLVSDQKGNLEVP